MPGHSVGGINSFLQVDRMRRRALNKHVVDWLPPDAAAAWAFMYRGSGANRLESERLMKRCYCCLSSAGQGNNIITFCRS